MAATMLDILSSPLRGYIAQNLQFYLSKYIEGIQLEGLGLFGGDLVLNDLEIKRHVLLESLEIPSSFDFARGFIRELRIHIPWTQLLSQPIEVKLYTIELILVPRTEAERVARRGSSSASIEVLPASTPGDAAAESDPDQPQKIDQPKSGWLHDTLQKILANISIQINNLVLKYEQDSIVLSVALGTLDVYSANAQSGWAKGFNNPDSTNLFIGKRVDAKDLTIFLDRYTSSGPPTDDPYLDRLHRKAVGYEVPVLSRASVSARGKLLFRTLDVGDGDNGNESPSFSSSVSKPSKIFDIDGLFVYEPSASRDPFYSYSCNRPSLPDMNEVDIFVGELLFSLSDRQLDMIVELVQSATRKMDEAHMKAPAAREEPRKPANNTNRARAPRASAETRAIVPSKSALPAPTTKPASSQSNPTSASGSNSWLSWAMNALVAPTDEEDELMVELLAESKESLDQANRMRQTQEIEAGEAKTLEIEEPSGTNLCVRACVSLISLTLRKHCDDDTVRDNGGAVDNVDTQEEQFVPVANLGMVKVTTPGKRSKVARPPKPILSMSLNYVALETLIARGNDKEAVGLVFEIETMEVVSISGYKDENPASGKGRSLVKWGVIDTTSYADYVSHPYFTASFFGDEARRLSKRHSRSFELVKVSFDTEIPVWKTMEVRETNAAPAKDGPCSCTVNWNGARRACIAKKELSVICDRVTSLIGIKERILDEGILVNAITSAWASRSKVIVITPVMNRELGLVVSDYRCRRVPDETPMLNLRRLLAPQLFLIFARFTLHTCSGTSPSSSSRDLHCVDERSAHSAVRLRFGRLVHLDTTVNDQVYEELQSRPTIVLDISLGEASATIDRDICKQVGELILGVTKSQESGVDSSAHDALIGQPESNLNTGDSGVDKSERSSRKIVTFAKVTISLVDELHADTDSAKAVEGQLGCSLSAADLIWRERTDAEGSSTSVQVGLISLDVPNNCQHVAARRRDIRIFETLGVDLFLSTSVATVTVPETKEAAFVSVHKLNADLSYWAVAKLAQTVDAFACDVANISLLNSENFPTYSPRLFQLQVTELRLSRDVSTSGQFTSSEQVTFNFMVGSASVYRTSLDKADVIKTLFESGSILGVDTDDEASFECLRVDVSHRKTLGLVVGTPLSSLLNTGLLNASNTDTRACTNSTVTIQIDVANIDGNLQEIFELVSDVSLIPCLLSDRGASPKHSSTSKTRTVTSSDNTLLTSRPTQWGVLINMKAQGAKIRLNTMLQLEIAPILIESAKTVNDHLRNGHIGHMELDCSLDSVRVDMNHTSSALSMQGSDRVLEIGGVRASVKCWHKRVENYGLHVLEAMLSVAAVETAMTRLKMRYLLDIPFVTRVNPSPPRAVENTDNQDAIIASDDSTPSHLWSYNVGLQVDKVGCSIGADIAQNHHGSRRIIRSIVLGQARSISLALRTGNHHPSNRQLQSATHNFTDVQLCVGDLHIGEGSRSYTPSKMARRYGVLSTLPDNAFLGILLCLEWDDLVSTTGAVHVDIKTLSDSARVPVAVRSWHLSSRLAKQFRAVKQNRAGDLPADNDPDLPLVPVLCTGHVSALESGGQSFPVISFFTRNYGEHGLSGKLVSGSIANFDVNVMTSALYCVSAVFTDLHHPSSSSRATPVQQPRGGTSSETIEHTAPAKSSNGNLQIFVTVGHIRVILSNEELFDVMEMQKVTSGGHVCFVAESFSVSSADTCDFSLDGLSYPPFNARLLPKHPPAHTARFGKSKSRIGCRVGKFYAAIMNLGLNDEGPIERGSLPLKRRGLFEAALTRAFGVAVTFELSETILCPSSATCYIEQSGSGDESARSVSIALTKIRVDLPKTSFDTIADRLLGISHGIQSFAAESSEQGKNDQDAAELVDSSEDRRDSSSVLKIDVKCDGLEVNLLASLCSVHIRFASVIVEHDFRGGLGSASIQNIAVGYRDCRVLNNTARDESSNEEVVFGVYADPTLWQVAVDNYQEKLISGRWSFPKDHEGSVFLDVQGFQLHVSAHVIQTLVAFVQHQPRLLYSSGLARRKPKSIEPHNRRRQPYLLSSKCALKVIVAPSILSLWEYNHGSGERTSSSAWISCGDVFASIVLGHDDSVERSLDALGPSVHDLNRFVAVKAKDFVLSIEKIGMRVSNDMQILQVRVGNPNSSSAPGYSNSSWPLFSKHIVSESEMRRVLEECSLRVTGEHHEIVERGLFSDERVVLFRTTLSQTTIQAELNAIRAKLSSYSLEAVTSLVNNCAREWKQQQQQQQHESQQDPPLSKEAKRTTNSNILKLQPSSDDFGHLQRIAESRHPSAGELAFVESLFIETASSMGNIADHADGQTSLFVDCSHYDDIDPADAVSFIVEVNEPWVADERDLALEQLSLPDLEINQTLSWMSMRWCYHIPRSIQTIVANPVPIPPSGVPRDWPAWSDKANSAQDHICDFVCQLRCWDYTSERYVLISEFYTPWDTASNRKRHHTDSDEPDTFGDLVSQWFDDDIENRRFVSSLVDIASQSRVYSIKSNFASDKWELRWRYPLHQDIDGKSAQTRFLLNTLLASSLRIRSTQVESAYRRAIVSASVPSVALAVCYVSTSKDSHDVITAELMDSTIACTIVGEEAGLDTIIRVNSSLQVYLENMIQLLSVSVIPRVGIGASIIVSPNGVTVSGIFGPTSVYLTQTSMLVLASIPAILQRKPSKKQDQQRNTVANAAGKLSDMRILIMNKTGTNMHCRQSGTMECVLVRSNERVPYSWMSLGVTPYYRMEFSLDPDSSAGDSEDKFQWSAPCPIKQRCVTGRYFHGRGYLWVDVKPSGLQTLVELRSSFTFRNYCDFPVHLKPDDHSAVLFCDKLCDSHATSAGTTSDECAVDQLASRSDAADENAVVTMMDSLRELHLKMSLDANVWYDAAVVPDLPSAFDLVKQRDDEMASQKRTAKQKLVGVELVDLTKTDARNGDHRFAWLKMERVKRNTLMPTDLELEFRLARRYTWVEATLWPAISVENMTDTPVSFEIAQKNVTLPVCVKPSGTHAITAINPLELSTVTMDLSKSDSFAKASTMEFDLQYAEQADDMIHCCGSVRITVTSFVCAEGAHSPSVRIRFERFLNVENMTPSTLSVRMRGGDDSGTTCETIRSCGSVFVGCVPGDELMVAIGQIGEGDNETRERWSPELGLKTTGASKVFVLPGSDFGTAMTFAIALVNSNGLVTITIRPHVIVTNSTDSLIRLVPTDGNSKTAISSGEVELEAERGWSVPVCVHKDVKKWTLTTDVSTWLNAKFSRRPSDDIVANPEQPQLGRLTCTFMVSLADEGFEWSEEIVVGLPVIPLLVTPSGELKSIDHTAIPTTSGATRRTSEYPSASSVTMRRRLLIRHKRYQHKMLTFTMTQVGLAVHISFFIDHQPPVIFLNQWKQMVGFRNVSAPSKPEGVSPNFYMEYDWTLQTLGDHTTIKEQNIRESDDDSVEQWLNDSVYTQETVGGKAVDDSRVRFQIGSPEFGWSNTLWQVGGIQFVSLSKEREDATEAFKLTFLVMCHYRAGSWVISVACLEDDSAESYKKEMPPLMLPPTASASEAKQNGAPKFLNLAIKIEDLGLHLCDEYYPLRDEQTGPIVYPEVFRVVCRSVVVAFSTSDSPPEALRHTTRLGYLSHVRAYSTLYIAVEDGEIDHFLEDCNYPVILCFQHDIKSREFVHRDIWQELDSLTKLLPKLLDKRIQGAEQNCVVVRVTYADTWDPMAIPSYFHNVEMKLAPAVLQVEDAIISHVYALLKPITDALDGSSQHSTAQRSPVVAAVPSSSTNDDWLLYFRDAAAVAMQRRVFIEHLVLSEIQVTVTARVTIPVLNSFDGTPLRFGESEMRNVFAFPDQLLKDIAADYVADAIVRSPMLLMSLNILGNPAGFFRNFSVGIRNLVEIPLAATQGGYNPWVLTKGVVGGVASFFGHAAAATLMSVSGFSYSISRTMDQLTLPSGQLQKRRYRRPTRLTSGLADGLGALGSSVVGAATGVITTPIAVYKERQLQGLDPGVGNVVGGVGMGLVGVVARPVGGVASLISMASDGLLYGSGMGVNRTPFEKLDSSFEARPNELLRYKLKVLPDAVGVIVFAHGVWVKPVHNVLTVPSEGLHYIGQSQLLGSDDVAGGIRSLLRDGDEQMPMIAITVVCSSTHLYLVGASGEQAQVVLTRAPLLSIQAIEESLREPTVFDLGIKSPTSAGVEWLRLRLATSQRRHVSNQLRLWLADSR